MEILIILINTVQQILVVLVIVSDTPFLFHGPVSSDAARG